MIGPLNFVASLRRSREARERRDWSAELHYGALAMVQGAGVGTLLGLAVIAIWCLAA